MRKANNGEVSHNFSIIYSVSILHIYALEAFSLDEHIIEISEVNLDR